MAETIDWSKFTPDTPVASASTTDWSQFVPEPQAQKPGLLRQAGDLALDVTQGAYGAIGAGASLFGADNPIAALANEIAQGAGQLQSADRQAEKQAQAQRMQDAEKSGSALNELGAAWENFKESPLSFAAQGIGSTIPTGIIAALAGVAGAPAAVGAGLTGLVGAGMGAGSVKSSIYQDQLQRGLAAGLSTEEAQAKALDAQAFTGENTDQIALGGALGTLDAFGIERMLAGGTSGIKNILGRTAVGTLAEMLPEGAQGGQERLASNLAAQRAGYDADTWTGVTGQGATEALASAGPGAVAGAMTPYQPPALDPNAGPISRAAIQATQQQAIGALPAPGQLSGDATMQMGEGESTADPTSALEAQRRNTELQDARAQQEAQRDEAYRNQVNGTQPIASATTSEQQLDTALPFTQPPYAGPMGGTPDRTGAEPRVAIPGEPIADPAAQLAVDRQSTGEQYLGAQRKRARGELLSQREAALLKGPDPFEGKAVSLASPTDGVSLAARDEAVQDVAFANGDDPANVRVFSSQDLPDAPSGNQRGAGLTRPAAAVIEGLGRIFGTQYRFYDSPNSATRGDGFVLRGRRDGVAYVRAVEGDAAPLVVAGHETYHTFTPQERARFSAAIEPYVDASDTAQLAFLSDYTGGKYQAKIKQLISAGIAPSEIMDGIFEQVRQDGKLNLDRAKLREEFDADIFGNRMKDTGFWEKVFAELKAQDRTLLVKIRDSIKQAISYLKSQAGKVRGFNTDQYIRDLDAVQKIAARTLLSAANTQQKSEQSSRGAETVVRSETRDRIGPYATESMAAMSQNWYAKKGAQYAIEQAADGFYLTRTGETNEGRQGQAERGRSAGAAQDAERGGSRDAAADVRQRAAGGSESAARQGRTPLAVESGVRTDGDGRVSLTGVHFSRQPRGALNGSYYGTGLKGAEARRLAGVSDRRLLSRVYVYVNEGKGVRPEAGVGSYAHTVEMSNLYDFVADPRKLIRKHQGDLNAVESAILDEGFDGYYVKDAFGNQGAAVLLGDASIGVQVKPVEGEVVRSATRTLEKENQVSVTVGGKPGEFGWSPAAKLAAAQQEPTVDPAKLIGKEVPPFVGPTQQRPNLVAIGESVRKVLSAKPARDAIEALTGAKVTGVSQIAGSWEGKPEPSFVLSGEMSFEQANEVSKVFGFLMAQDATVAAQPWFEDADDQIPAILISQGKAMSAEQVKALSDAARSAGLDYSTTMDGRGAKFLHFGDQDGYLALRAAVDEIRKAAGLKELTDFYVRSNLNEAESYLESGVGILLRAERDQDGTSGPSDLFRRAVDSILVPYAKAVGAEGYRFSPERYGQRFGLTGAEVSYIRAALRPKSGKALSTVPIVTGTEKLKPPRNNTRTKERGVTKNDLLWALQSRTAEVGFIEPGDYSPEARKIIADAIADEVIYNLGKESGKNAVGWYDAALKKAKETYEQVFPELRQDKDREMLFDAILGIASQGNDVHSNAVFAGRMYHLITREQMTLGQATKALSGTFGKQTVAIEKNYAKLEHLLDTNGYDRMREFFNTTATVGELNATLRKDETLFGPNGKPLKIDGAAEQTVSGWMVFGPKIGSFINNLHGDYSTLTADLWFSRTWNRMLGYVFNHKAGKENDQYVKLYRAMVEEARTGVGRDLVGTSQAEIDAWAADPESMLTFARETHLKREAEYKEIRDDAVTPLRQAAKNLLENREEATEIPRTDWERYFQQTTVEQAQKVIRRKTGVDISIADIQAVLWYHEKDLYKSFGVGDSKAEAADYADAAARFVDRFNEGELFFVEKPKPRYVVGEKGSYLGDGGVVRSSRRILLAPNGSPSKLSEAQWHQVRTPEFKRWFGDWEAFATREYGVWEDSEGVVSKAVDPETGEPQVFYHGTPDAGFTVFEGYRNPRGTPSTFFTSYRPIAETYSGRQVGEAKLTGKGQEPGIYSVFLNIRNPHEVDFEGANWDGARTDQYEVLDGEGDNIYAPDGRGYFDLETAEALAADVPGSEVRAAETFWHTTNSAVEDARSQGYDGAILRDVVDNGPRADVWEPSDVFVTFSPEQIKSATGNTGSFDPTNPDITRSTRRLTESQAFKDWFGDSKMVARDGTPLTFMHGSPENFDAFDSGRLGRSSGHGSARLGFFFTRDSSTAERYADGGNIYRGWLAIQRPYLMPLSEAQAFEEAADSARRRQELRSKGFDGVVILDDQRKPWAFVAFEPWQFKSVDNRGTFDAFDDGFLRSTSRAASAFGDISQAQEAALRAVGLLREPKTIRERFAELTDNLAKRLTQGVVDQYAPLKELDFRSYVLARMSKGTDGTFEATLYYGRPKVNGDTVEIDTTSGGLMEVLSSLSGEQDRFLAWVAANRADQIKQAQERAERDVASLKQELKNLREMRQLAATRPEIQQTAEAVKAAEKMLAEAQTRAQVKELLFTDEHIRQLKDLNQGQMADGRGRAIEYARVLREFNAFQDSVLAIAEARGLIDAESRQVWRDGFYVPFYRNMEDGTTGPSVKSGLVNQYAFKKLKGSSRQLNEDLLANTLQNMAHLLSAAAKNQAAMASLRAAESAGVAHRVPSGTKGAVRFLDGGREQHYLVDDPFIFDAITSLESVKVVGLEKVLSKFKHWLTLGVTINPAFQLRSLMRDAIQSVAITKIDTNPLANVKQGIASQLAKDQDYINALASGGLIRFNSLIEGNRADRTRKLIKMGVADSTILDTREKIEMFFTKALDKVLLMGDISESTNRMALYKQQIAAGVDPLLAAYQARDLMDFSMQGQWRAVRFLTQVVPFLNARLQGLYKLGRDGVVPTAKVLFGGGNASDKQIAKRFGAVTGAVALASIALMAAYEDDEDWQKREDWDRDTYWWFKIGDVAYRIPKPFEVGAIGTLAERTAELFSSDEMTGTRFMQRLGHMVSSTFALNPIPQMVKPLLDVYANEDSFTQRPIETMGMERLQPKDRFTGQTSELAKWLGQLGLPEPGRLMAGQYQALSPVQIDALIRGYFSWLGVSATRIVDEGVRAVADRPARPEMQLRDIFFAGNFVEGLPANASRYVTALYDQSKAIEQAYASYRFALRQGDRARAEQLLAEEGDKIRLNPLVTYGKDMLSKLNENIRAIERDMTMSPAEKRAQIDRIKALQNQIAMRVSARLQ